MLLALSRCLVGLSGRRESEKCPREGVGAGSLGPAMSAMTRMSASASISVPTVSDTETPWARPWSATAQMVTRMPSPSDPPELLGDVDKSGAAPASSPLTPMPAAVSGASVAP